MKNKTRFSEEKSLKDLLQDFKKKDKLSKGFNQLAIEEAWQNELGPAIKNYTKSIQLSRGKLFVKLTSSTLREELSYGKQKIIDMLNEKVGENVVKELILI
jgi:hypothetical protein